MSNELEKMLEEFINRKKYERCSKCAGNMHYSGWGTYECRECGIVVQNNYGKICQYLSAKGTATIPEISKETGLRFSEVEEILRNTDALHIVKDQKTKRSIDLMHDMAEKIAHK